VTLPATAWRMCDTIRMDHGIMQHNITEARRHVPWKQ
jgi:hypothetical protein